MDERDERGKVVRKMPMRESETSAKKEGKVFWSRKKKKQERVPSLQRERLQVTSD